MHITDAPVHAALAAVDLARARAWYADKLGWEPSRDREARVAATRACPTAVRMGRNGLIGPN